MSKARKERQSVGKMRKASEWPMEGPTMRHARAPDVSVVANVDSAALGLLRAAPRAPGFEPSEEISTSHVIAKGETAIHTQIPDVPVLYDAAFEDHEGTKTSQTKIQLPTRELPRKPLVTVLAGLSAGFVMNVEVEELSIGRSHECALRLMDPGVSRRHALIRRRAKYEYVLVDLGSTNGTYLNGRPATEAPLNEGDRIQLGPDAVVRFGWGDHTEETLARQLYDSATRDPLTQVYTRRFFEERAEAEFGYARRHASDVSIILMDLDHFKSVNDVHGHLMGDHVLRMVAKHVDEIARAEDLFARYGGEEFAMLLRGASHRHAMQCAERIRAGVETIFVPVEDGGADIRPTVSLGVASLAEIGHASQPADLLRLADERLYVAKRNGRNRVEG